jgi:uncharacterized membrane protein
MDALAAVASGASRAWLGWVVFNSLNLAAPVVTFCLVVLVTESVLHVSGLCRATAPVVALNFGAQVALGLFGVITCGSSGDLVTDAAAAVVIGELLGRAVGCVLDSRAPDLQDAVQAAKRRVPHHLAWPRGGRPGRPGRPALPPSPTPPTPPTPPLPARTPSPPL